MKIIDHGKWIPYKPEVFPKDAPPTALFAKRESDGKDWYQHVNDPASFQPDTVKIAFSFHEAEKEWIIGPAVIDATMIFPANHYVREIDGFGSTDENEIIAAFRNKVIDIKTNAMKDRPKNNAPSLIEMLNALTRRIEKLEERMK
jgi:hypothetical protein